MPAKSSNCADIAKLLEDAFVRICQLAIANCGVSVAELTLHLSIQLNTAVPQPEIVSTTIVETIRSTSADAECPAAKDGETLHQTEYVGDKPVDRRTEKDGSMAGEHGFDSRVPRDDSESEEPSRGTDIQIASCHLVVNSLNGLLLSASTSDYSPVHDLLANVDRHDECDKYGCESHMGLSDSRGNSLEADEVYAADENFVSLSNLTSSEEHALAPVDDACVLSTLESYSSANALTSSAGEKSADDGAFESSGWYDAENALLRRHCKQGASCSNPACIPEGSVFREVSEFVEDALSVDRVPGVHDAESRVDDLSTSRHSSSMCSVTDGSLGLNATSREEEEEDAGSCSDSHRFNNTTTENSATSLDWRSSGWPVCTKLATFVTDMSLLKSYPANHLLSAFCSGVQTSDAALVSSYSKQPGALSVSPERFRFVTGNACDMRKTEFLKTLSIQAKSASIMHTHRGKCLMMC